MASANWSMIPTGPNNGCCGHYKGEFDCIRGSGLDRGLANVANLDVAALVEQLCLRWRTTLGLALLIACQATCNYALLGWGPAFFERVHHWPKNRIGLVLGLTTLVCGCFGLFVGGRLSDCWQDEGITDSPLRVGLLGLTGVGLTLAPAMLMTDPGWTVALLIHAAFFIGLPSGCGYAAVQLIFPDFRGGPDRAGFRLTPAGTVERSPLA
jgi:MFS family permease